MSIQYVQTENASFSNTISIFIKTNTEELNKYMNVNPVKDVHIKMSAVVKQLIIVQFV